MDVPLIPGSNTVSVYAQNSKGMLSLTTNVTFVYVLSAPLVVQTSGPGTVTPNAMKFVYMVCDWLTLITTGKGTIAPNYSNVLLEIGAINKITATPATGYVFSNRLGTVGQVLTNGRTLRFAMESNLVLTANFIPNPFIPAAGSYWGLFYNTNGIEQASPGSFSANFQQGLKTNRASGQFSVAGTWVTNALSGWSNTAVWLQLDLSGGDAIMVNVGYETFLGANQSGSVSLEAK